MKPSIVAPVIKCFKVFFSKSDKTFVDEDFNDMEGSGLADVYDSAYEFCEKLINSPRIVEFKEIRKLMQEGVNDRVTII